MNRRSAPVWVLLVVLALVPTFGMGVLAVRAAGESAAMAQSARTVARDVDEAVHLLELVFAVTDEHVPTQGIVHAGTFDLTTDEASALIGFDFEERRSRARKVTDAVLADLPAHLRQEFPLLDGVDEGIAEVRRLADAPGTQPEEIYDHFTQLAEMTETAAKNRIDKLTTTDEVAVAIDPAVRSALDALSSGVAVFRASQQQGVAMADLLFAPDDVRARLQLAYSAADYRREVADLAGQPDPTVAEAWTDISERMDMQRLDRMIASMQVDPPAFSDLTVDELADAFGDAFTRIDLMAGLNRVAADSAIAAANDVEVRAGETHRRTVLYSSAIGVLAIGLAVVVSWSISRPLRQLARRAGMVTEGRSAGPDPARRGPREVQIVAGALEEAAGSLRRVEEQAQALAAGDFDSVVLERPVPGVLGESVHASVEQLSRSIRAQEELRNRLAHQAHHDPLTGLLNRAGYLAVAEEAAASAHATGGRVGVLFIDLDGFKRANDSHGHGFGDEVLRATAARLLDTVADTDTVVRLGGDEFLVVTPSVTDLAGAMAFGNRIIGALSRPVVIGGRRAQLGASVGVTVSGSRRTTALDLLKEADQAVHRAKRRGGGRVDAFDEAFREEQAESSEIEALLRTGIPNGELELYYQPVIQARSNSLQGFEALARWHRPGRGLVSPIDFIPVAEASDLVLDVGRWVLAEATTQLASWSGDPALGSAHVSVNISGRHLLDATIVDDVRGALDGSGLDPARLVVEITETVILNDLAVAVRHLQALRALGVRIALDDFGTGYTSIGQLGQLPIDILKIDREFVSGLGRQPQGSIVELMVEVAHTLGLGLVAEGVEEAAQLLALQRLACDDVQGYLIARPLVAVDAASWSAGQPVGPSPGPPVGPSTAPLHR